MGQVTKVTGVDTRGIERAVREEYAANQDAWHAMCGIGRPFPTVFDLIASKEALLTKKANADIGLIRSALASLRVKRFLAMVEEDLCEDVTEADVQAYLDAKS